MLALLMVLTAQVAHAKLEVYRAIDKEPRTPVLRVVDRDEYLPSLPIESAVDDRENERVEERKKLYTLEPGDRQRLKIVTEEIKRVYEFYPAVESE